MEIKIQELFRTNGWDTKLGFHYSDQETKKWRECDVLSSDTFKTTNSAIGAPLHNVYVACECKSLSGFHILFHHDPKLEKKHWLDMHWCGSEIEIARFTRYVCDELEITDRNHRKKLRDFLYKRAYEDHPADRYPRIYLPDANCVSSSFRETNIGNEREGSSSVIWNTIMILRSQTDDHNAMCQNRPIDLVGQSNDIKLRNLNEVIDSINFFYNAYLLRYIFFHRVIFVRANLWNHDIDGNLSPVISTRIDIQNRTHSFFSVDIVSFDHAEIYINNFVHNTRKQATRSVKKLLQLVHKHEWDTRVRIDELIDIVVNGQRSSTLSRVSKLST